MTKQEKIKYFAEKTVYTTYFSAFDGLEIKSIEYGIEDYVIFVYYHGEQTNINDVHKSKIYYSANDHDYFRFNGKNIYFADCIRTGL